MKKRVEYIIISLITKYANNFNPSSYFKGKRFFICSLVDQRIDCLVEGKNDKKGEKLFQAVILPCNLVDERKKYWYQ